MATSPELLARLEARGVIVHCPAATLIEDVDPERFEPGVEVFAGCTIRGQRTAFGRGTALGRAGGGFFANVVTGRNVELWGGSFEDCVLLDGCVIRGHAELRAGTVLEEGCEAAHHVGYKMTVQMPFTVAGSLVNFCDALFAGGTSRDDHGEIGSCLALYNYTPWGDKFASMFGDVPRGVTLRAPRVFVGGQTQIVSPVRVGFGTVVAAGTSLRRSVGDNRLVGDPAPAIGDRAFDPEVYGAVRERFELQCTFAANLRALMLWHERVRRPAVGGSAHQRVVLDAAAAQLGAGVRERIKRLDGWMPRIARSAELLASRAAGVPEERASVLIERAAEQRDVVAAWPHRRAQLQSNPALHDESALDEAAGVIAEACADGASYVEAVRSALTDALAARVTDVLERYVAELAS